MIRRCVVYNLKGLTCYETAWKYQKVLSEHIFQTKKILLKHATLHGDSDLSEAVGYPDDAVIIVEHPRIFTLGRGATKDNLKFDYKAYSDSGGEGEG